MKLVANNSDESVRVQQARVLADAAARNLFANMLRVLRGAGKPFLLPYQMLEDMTDT